MKGLNLQCLNSYLFTQTYTSMKKQLLLLVLFIGLFCGSNFAQGKLFCGVDLGFSDNDNHSSFNLGPRVGFGIGDRSALVVGINFENHKDKGPDLATTSFGVGAEYRYGWNVGDNVFLYLAPGVAFSSDKEEQATGGDLKSTTFDIRIAPGLSYKLADKWSINTHFGALGYSSTTPDGGDAFGTFGLDLSMSSIGFGLWYHIQ